MKRLSKLGIITLLVALGIMSITTGRSNPDSEGNTKNKLILFGAVDLSDDEDIDSEEYLEDEGSDEDEGNWLENFIKTHKTPFSKTIKE